MISIVIPAYNAEKYLAETVQSVLSQTVTDWELVIVDDGSQDGTRSIAESCAGRDPRIRTAHQPNGGVAVARNFGFSQTSPHSEYVIFLDNDDLWEPEMLAVQTEALERNSGAVGAYASARYIDGAGRPVREGALEEWTRGERRRVCGDRLTACAPGELTGFDCFAVGPCVVTPGTLLIRRPVLEDVGGFDRAVTPAEDYDMNLRLTRRGGMVFIDRVLLDYRIHAANVSGNKRLLTRRERGSRRKQIASPENTPEQKRLLVEGFRLRERELYALRMRESLAGLRRDPGGSAKMFLYGQANLLRSLHGRP